MVQMTALFPDLDSCLRWAFRSTPIVMKPGVLARMVGRDERASPADEDAVVRPTVNPDIDAKPTGLDAAAQKGMLLGYVNRQPVPERFHLIAKYAIGDERKGAQIELRDYLLPLMNDILRHRWVMLQCVGRYYGKPVTFKDLGARILYLIPPVEGEKPETRMGRAWRSVRETSREIDDHLKSLASRTEEQCYGELKARGVIA